MFEAATVRLALSEESAGATATVIIFGHYELSLSERNLVFFRI
jgi:hypothetical protein